MRSKERRHDGFYSPSQKELGLGVCYVLERAGGELTFERVADVLGDLFQIPEHARKEDRLPPSPYTQWTYYLAWAATSLRKDGFLAGSRAGERGMCTLTQAGHELGRWACKIYDGENPAFPTWVQAFLEPTFGRMVGFLNGGRRRKPPDYELCRWVRYCYLLGEAELGAKIFDLILEDHVAPELFRQAARQARALKNRVQEGRPAASGRQWYRDKRAKVEEAFLKKKRLRNSLKRSGMSDEDVDSFLKKIVAEMNAEEIDTFLRKNPSNRTCT